MLNDIQKHILEVVSGMAADAQGAVNIRANGKRAYHSNCEGVRIESKTDKDGIDIRNGCREILCVELPWIEKAFGKIKSVEVMSGRLTSLDIDFPDYYMISVTHEGGCKGFYCQDIIARKGLRRLEVFSEKLHLFWEGTPDSLSSYNLGTKTLESVRLYDDVVQDGRYNANIIENAYLDEINAFFDYVEKGTLPPYTFEEDAHTLAVVDEIEGIKRI